MKRLLLSLVLLAAVTLLFSDRSSAIPAFARKYKTSCQTCHNGFPKLNAFGEAFRRNGYQFPGGTDPDYIKDEPVSLGSDGNKKAFPDAIWPGTLPASSPLTLQLIGEVDYNPSPITEPGAPRITFDGLGNSIEGIAAGTLGEDLGFWGHAILHADGTVELNRIFAIFSNLVGSDLNLNLRAGVFEPSLFSFSTHRSWFEGYWMTTRPFSNDMGWSIEEIQKGLEANGIFAGRFSYSAGVVEGYGMLHSGKDYYGHLAYKFGGMRSDGIVDDTSAATNTQPWIDNSVTVGTFAYDGNALMADSLGNTQPNDFTMFGGDVNIFYDRFNLFGGVGLRHDNQPFVGTANVSANTTTWFTELDVTVYPWLLPGVRYENWLSHTLATGTSTTSYTDEEYVPGIVFLVRPNVKLTLQTAIEKFDSRGDTDFHFDTVILEMNIVM